MCSQLLNGYSDQSGNAQGGTTGSMIEISRFGIHGGRMLNVFSQRTAQAPLCRLTPLSRTALMAINRSSLLSNARHVRTGDHTVFQSVAGDAIMTHNHNHYPSVEDQIVLVCSRCAMIAVPILTLKCRMEEPSGRLLMEI